MTSPRLAETAAEIRSRRRSAEEHVRAALPEIERRDRDVRAFLSIDSEHAIAQAREIDRRIAAGEDLPLAGALVGAKDNMAVSGLPATCGSRILEGFRPGYDATVIARLKTAGAVIVGKTNLDEFAMGSSTENSAFFPTRNPWDLERVPGGSSGGSAAAVASRQVSGSLGSDTGGSVRQPAALCGVVGYKPTYGRVSRFGLTAFASSLDQIGPFATSVEDAARLYAVIAGVDPRDSTTSSLPIGDPVAACVRGAGELRIGVLAEASVEGVDPDVTKNFDAAIKVLRKIGARISSVSVPRAPYAIPIYYVIANAEASSNLARFDGIRYGPRQPAASLDGFYEAQRTSGFGMEVQRRIMIGTFALSAGYADAYYGRASRARALLAADFAAAFSSVDLIACPTSPVPAFRIGERSEDPLAMYLADIYTTPASLAGLPAISVPSGFSSAGLPLGLQLVGPRFADEVVLAAAAAFERETRFGDALPPSAR